jgi:hypothetical protein
MKLFRKIITILGTALFVLSAITAVGLFSTTTIFAKPDNLKHWLKDSGVYNHVVDAVIAEQDSKKDTQKDSELSRPEVKKAFGQAFSPVWLQQTADTVLDGTYTWLDGKAPKPTYVIDLTAPKQALAASLTQSAHERLDVLPACSASNPPTSDDPFTLNCRPTPDIEQAGIQKLTNDITNNKDFLPNNQITADSVDLGKDDSMATLNELSQPKQPWYQQANQLPSFFKSVKRLPFLIGGFALLMGVMVIFSASSKRKGLRTLAFALLGSSIFLGIGALTFWAASTSIKGPDLLKSTSSTPATQVLQGSIANFIKDVIAGISRVQAYGAIGLALISGGVLITLHLTKPKSKPLHTSTLEEPETEDLIK